MGNSAGRIDNHGFGIGKYDVDKQDPESAQVMAGCKMTIFSEAGFKGEHTTINGPSMLSSEDVRWEDVDLQAVGWTQPVRSLKVECHPDSAAAKRKDKFQATLLKIFATGVALLVGGIVLAVFVIIFVFKLLFNKRSTQQNLKGDAAASQAK